MPIPSDIQREHILEAMLKIKREGVPPGREAREWAVKYEGELYPCKLLISWGCFYALGYELDPTPTNFQTYMAQQYLEGKNFRIVPL